MKNFTRHRNLCAKKRRKHPLKIGTVPVTLLEATIKHSNVPQDFLKHILNKLRDDIFGTIYGRIKRKKDKKVQVSMQVFTFIMVFQSHWKQLYFKELHNNGSACTCSHLIFFLYKIHFFSVCSSVLGTQSQSSEIHKMGTVAIIRQSCHNYHIC